MYDYLGVKAVEKLGKKVDRNPGKYQPRIPVGHQLIAITDNGAFKIAPNVTDVNIYASVYESYYQGKIIDFDLYLLKDDQVAECPDEGRVYD